MCYNCFEGPAETVAGMSAASRLSLQLTPVEILHTSKFLFAGAGFHNKRLEIRVVTHAHWPGAALHFHWPPCYSRISVHICGHVPGTGPWDKLQRQIQYESINPFTRTIKCAKLLLYFLNLYFNAQAIERVRVEIQHWPWTNDGLLASGL